MPFVSRSRRWAVTISLATAVPFALCATHVAASESYTSTAHVIRTPSFTLQDIVGMVLAANPKLQGQHFALRAADGRSKQAALRPPLEVGAEVENVLGSGRTRSFDSAEATLRLSTVLEMGGKRGARVVRASRERELLALELDAQRLDLLSDVARRFIRTLAAEARIALAVEHRELADQAEKWVARRLEAGAGAPVERGVAQLAAREARIKEAASRNEARQAWAMLAAAWGGAPDGNGAPAGDLFNLPQLEAYADLATAVETSPSLTRFASERRVADAKLRLAQASAIPDVNVNAGVRWLEASGDHALVLGASVPLGTSSRSVGARLEAESQGAQLASTESDARFNLMAMLYALHSQATQARLTLAALTDDLKPIAEKTLHETERGFREGRFTHLELFTAQEKLHDVDEQRVQAAVAYHEAVSEIERLTGEAVGFAKTSHSAP